MKDLASITKNAAAEAFLSKREQRSPNQLSRSLMLKQIQALLAAEVQQPCHRFEATGQPFDRLLLANSRHYLRTRTLSRRLGVTLEPSVKSLERGYSDFSCTTATVEYTPIRAELLRFLDYSEKSATSDTRRWQEFLRLRELVTALYHELNHAILFRTVRPSSRLAKHPQAAKLYHYFVEALAWMRDHQLAREIGKPALPLVLSGALYKAPALKVDVRPLNHDRFLESLHATYSRYLGNLKYGRLATKDRWFEQYLKTHGNALELPDAASEKTAPLIWLDVQSADDLIRDRKKASKICEWFFEVFPNAKESMPRDAQTIKQLFIGVC